MLSKVDQMTDKFLIMLLSLAFAALMVGPLKAQGARQCGPRDTVLIRLAERYGETRQAIGLGANNAIVEVFASPATGSWTITVTVPNGVTCLVASGQAFETLAETLPAKDNDA